MEKWTRTRLQNEPGGTTQKACALAGLPRPKLRGRPQRPLKQPAPCGDVVAAGPRRAQLLEDPSAGLRAAALEPCLLPQPPRHLPEPRIGRSTWPHRAERSRNDGNPRSRVSRDCPKTQEPAVS